MTYGSWEKSTPEPTKPLVRSRTTWAVGGGVAGGQILGHMVAQGLRVVLGNKLPYSEVQDVQVGTWIGVVAVPFLSRKIKQWIARHP